MYIDVDREGTVEGLVGLLQRAKEKGAKGVMILACDQNGFTKEVIDPIVQATLTPLFGGIFPEVIFKDEKLEKGTALLGFMDEAPYIHVVENISSETTDIGEAIADMEENPFKTMFVYVDAFSTQIETVIQELYYEFGLDNNFIGGGAGSLSFVQKPVLFTNQGLLQDALVLSTINANSGIGVKHGWKSIDGPFQITKSDKNVILELDYKSAFEVYKGVVEKHSGRTFNDENFFDIAKGYPFGVTKIGSEKVVRDPITQENGAMVCVGNVKTGDYVDILSGEKTNLVNAATQAHAIGSEGIEGDGHTTLFIDCISRVLFLEADFQEELDAVAKKSNETIGALTLGEIANTGNEYLEFYNKTSVVAVF
jgi:hypothetical protein